MSDKSDHPPVPEAFLPHWEFDLQSFQLPWPKLSYKHAFGNPIAFKFHAARRG